MANKPEDFPEFTPLDSVVVKEWMDKFKQYLHNAAAVLGKDPSEITFHRHILYEIFTRVEKRRIYFHIYPYATTNERPVVSDGAAPHD